MDDGAVFDRMDKKAVELHEARLFAGTTLQLLRELKSGKVTLDRVQVDKDGWRLADPEPEPLPFPAKDGEA